MADQISTELSEIKKLHSELCGITVSGLEKALKIGEILTEIKGRFTHGNWTIWVESKLPFGMDQAQNYMKIFAGRKKLTGAPQLSFTKALKVVKSKTDGNRLLRSANQGVTKNSQKGEKSELTPEQQAEADIKSASSPEQNGEPEKAVDAQGVPITKEALPHWKRKQEVQDLLTAISKIRCRLEKAHSENDRVLGWLANSVVPNLDRAYAGVTNAMPYAVCVECGGHPDEVKCTVCHGTGLISKYAFDFQADKGKLSIRTKSHANRSA